MPQLYIAFAADQEYHKIWISHYIETIYSIYCINLLLNLLQSLPHPILSRLNCVDLPHQRVLRRVIDQIDSLSTFSVINALRCDPHRTFGLGQSSFQVLPRLHQMVCFVDVAFQFRLGKEKVVDIIRYCCEKVTAQILIDLRYIISWASQEIFLGRGLSEICL